MQSEKKRGSERTQKAVRDEWWTDERIQSYLVLVPPAGEDADFHCINKAYQGMVPESFARFIDFFTEANRDLNAVNREGKTISDIIAEHRHGKAYLKLLIIKANPDNTSGLV